MVERSSNVAREVANQLGDVLIEGLERNINQFPTQKLMPGKRVASSGDDKAQLLPVGSDIRGRNVNLET